MPKRELSGSPSVEDAAFDLPPSVDLTKPLTSSYSYHSVIPQTLFDDEVILGHDRRQVGLLVELLTVYQLQHHHFQVQLDANHKLNGC